MHLAEGGIIDMLLVCMVKRIQSIWPPLNTGSHPTRQLYLINTRPCILICHNLHCCPVFADWLVSFCIV